MRWMMWLSVFLILAVLLLASIRGFADRDGKLYRLASKLTLPLTKNMLSPLRAEMLSPFTASLQEPLPGWQWFQPELVNSHFGNHGLEIKSLTETVWWKNNRGSSYFFPITGDVEAEVTVRTRKQSDPANYPNQDYQFGGIILRDNGSNALFGKESYVFNVIGYRGEGLQVESKSTLDGYSKVSGYDWVSGDARLKVVRKSDDVYLYAQAINSQEWLQVNHFHRPDLPETLELGLIAYAYSYGAGRHDLLVTFSDLSIR